MSRAPASAAAPSGTPFAASIIVVGRRLDRGVGGRACPEQLGQRLEAALARYRRAGTAFGPVRKVEVLERLLRLGPVDRGSQRVIELALALDTLEDRRAALVELREVLRAVAHVAELDFVEAAGDFLPVAGDEGEGVALAEEREGVGDLLRG
jgi:hypothetical protein